MDGLDGCSLISKIQNIIPAIPLLRERHLHAIPSPDKEQFSLRDQEVPS